MTAVDVARGASPHSHETIAIRRRKPLSRTGLFVSDLCLGTVIFGGNTMTPLGPCFSMQGPTRKLVHPSSSSVMREAAKAPGVGALALAAIAPKVVA